MNNCSTCCYWIPNNVKKERIDCTIGDCCRHAPIVLHPPDSEYETNNLFPKTHSSQWCGDFKLYYSV